MPLLEKQNDLMSCFMKM